VLIDDLNSGFRSAGENSKFEIFRVNKSPQGLKPRVDFGAVAARLKSCPVTKRSNFALLRKFGLELRGSYDAAANAYITKRIAWRRFCAAWRAPKQKRATAEAAARFDWLLTR
jgi:hypothetical protein